MFETKDKSKQKNDGAVIEDENIDRIVVVNPHLPA